MFCGNYRFHAGRVPPVRAPDHEGLYDLLYVQLLGGFAEKRAGSRRGWSRRPTAAPDSVPLALAPWREPLACAVHALEVIEVPERVTILGGGSLGCMLAALVAARGTEPLLLDPHPERLAVAERFGARTALATFRTSSRRRSRPRGPRDRGRRSPRGVGARRADGRARRHREPVRRLRARQRLHRAHRPRALRGGHAPWAPITTPRATSPARSTSSPPANTHGPGLDRPHDRSREGDCSRRLAKAPAAFFPQPPVRLVRAAQCESR